MNLNVVDEEYFESIKALLFEAINESVWICEVKKSKMKCILRHFFDVNDFTDFWNYDFDKDEFEEYYKEHHIKYTSESDYLRLKGDIENDS